MLERRERGIAGLLTSECTEDAREELRAAEPDAGPCAAGEPSRLIATGDSLGGGPSKGATRPRDLDRKGSLEGFALS